VSELYCVFLRIVSRIVSIFIILLTCGNSLSCFTLGKTAFLNLLVYYASDMDVDVVLHDATRKCIFLLHSNGKVENIAASDLNDLPALDSEKTLYLFNPDETGTQAIESLAFTVITAAGEKQCSNFSKLPNMNVLSLLPWTLDEAHAALEALQPTRKLTAEQAATLKERFDQIGGSIRYLTYPQRKYNTDVKPLLKRTRSIPLVSLET